MLDYLSNHWRQIPHVANNGPAGHYSQQIAHDVVFAAVPEGISKLRIILQRVTKNKWLSLSPDHHSLSDLGLCGRTSSRCHPFAWTAEELSLLWAGRFSYLQLQEGLVGFLYLPAFWRKKLTPSGPTSQAPYAKGLHFNFSHLYSRSHPQHAHNCLSYCAFNTSCIETASCPSDKKPSQTLKFSSQLFPLTLIATG